LFGYYIISPLAVNFLGNYQVSDKISNIIDVSSFMTTVISVSFAAAIAFQLPLLIRLLASIGLVTSDGMRQYRKIAIVALLVFAAVITPPDVVSQCLIFVPCYILYEYGIGIAERIEKRRAKEEAEYQAKMAAEQQAQREQAEKERIAQQQVQEEAKAQAEAEEQSAESVADTESEELAADGANEPEVRKVTFEVADQESTDDKA
jgi:hypothetical protein